MRRLRLWLLAFQLTLLAAVPLACGARDRVALEPCHVEGVKAEVRCGVYSVFENRDTQRGRTLPLKIVLIPARHPHPDRGPIFLFDGGPGETATDLAADVASSGDAEELDGVMVDERGTGDGHRLDCPPVASDDHLEGYLKAPFEPAAARACSSKLGEHYDLSRYTTAAFVEDLDEVRRAMGYDQINLQGGSFGTYAALMYLRAHGDHVRSAYLVSLVLPSNTIPLYHAQSAQHALEELFDQCKRDAPCQAAYPRLGEDFAAILARVHQGPVPTWVHHPVTGQSTEVHLTEAAFVDAVRVLMYSGERGRQVPLLIEQARSGDFSPFAEASLSASRNIYGGARIGMNYSITCNEFVSRIRPEDVGPATRASYLGAWRVNDQMKACKEWPKTEVPGDFFRPFRSSVPSVLVSGDADPVTPPKWGEEAKSIMTRAVHVIVPGGGHTPDNACTRSIRAALFRTGTIQGLDVSCIAKVQPPPFRLPSTPVTPNLPLAPITSTPP